jgi:photosystem II stability/assembly factor-like uncharacterized protein
LKSASIVAMLALLAASAAAQWRMQESHTKESLRGLSVWSESVVWASGTHGTYSVTRDGGQTWKAAQVPGAEDLDFRDVEAFGDVVYLLAAGLGDKSRIYKTVDGGAHWELQFTNHDSKGFFDCMAFWNQSEGIAVGDPVDGKFEILTTENGGRNWTPIDRAKMPAAIEGEGAFAASGTCIAVADKGWAWFVTGGSAARLFRSGDRGRNWSAAEMPIQHGPASAGIFSVAFRDAIHGVVAGGDYQHPEQGGANLAITEDFGKTWTPAVVKEQRYFSGIAYLRNGAVVAVGATASGFSEDGLKSWKWLSSEGFNAVAADAKSGTVWAVGAGGKIARFRPGDR